MIDRREVLDIAGTLGLLPHVVEKDYMLGWGSRRHLSARCSRRK